MRIVRVAIFLKDFRLKCCFFERSMGLRWACVRIPIIDFPLYFSLVELSGKLQESPPSTSHRCSPSCQNGGKIIGIPQEGLTASAIRPEVNSRFSPVWKSVVPIRSGVWRSSIFVFPNTSRQRL